MANPGQLRKTLTAGHASDLPAIEVIAQPPDGSTVAALGKALDAISHADARPEIDVLVLARYGFLLDEVIELPLNEPRLKVRYMTVHKAKGLEADYAVVLGVVSGRHGFPAEIHDDPLLGLVLANKGDFPHAEERRLFYVALTRARIKTFILTAEDQRSVFVDELESPAFASLVIASGAQNRAVTCPTCRGGRFRLQAGEGGTVWSCSNLPGCRTKATKCPRCGSRSLVPDGKAFRCVSPDCGMVTAVCPKCGVGALVPRESRYGQFWGCSEWRAQGASCSYKTESAPL